MIKGEKSIKAIHNNIIVYFTTSQVKEKLHTEKPLNTREFKHLYTIKFQSRL